MNHDSNNWEHQLDGALKSLPELKAPPTLMPGVLAQIRSRAALPWYRQSWPWWPRAAQATTLAVFLVLAGALGFGLWQFLANGFTVTTSSSLTGSFRTFGALWSVAGVLKDLALLTLKHVGPIVLAGLFTIVFFSYVVCIGAGTAVFRLARIRH